MYRLFIANKNYSSWSLRPWVLLRELKIAFAEDLHRFQTGGAWSAFRAFSPSGRVPALHDGDTVVWDSLAIAEYLGERHAGVWPASPAARSWARCAAAEMHSGFAVLREQCSFNAGLRVRLRSISPLLDKDIMRLSELWNEGLSKFGGPFLAGSHFTAVDAFYAPVAFRAQTYGLKFDGAAQAYVQRLLALGSMQDWYASALAEDFRDLGHDDVVTKYGEIVEDRRVASK